MIVLYRCLQVVIRVKLKIKTLAKVCTGLATLIKSCRFRCVEVGQALKCLLQCVRCLWRLYVAVAIDRACGLKETIKDCAGLGTRTIRMQWDLLRPATALVQQNAQQWQLWDLMLQSGPLVSLGALWTIMSTLASILQIRPMQSYIRQSIPRLKWSLSKLLITSRDSQITWKSMTV